MVLTNVSDKKYFKFLAGTRMLDNKNVQFDQNNKIGELSNTTMYPKVIFLDKGKIKSIVEVTPNDKNIWHEIEGDKKNIYEN